MTSADHKHLKERFLEAVEEAFEQAARTSDPAQVRAIFLDQIHDLAWEYSSLLSGDVTLDATDDDFVARYEEAMSQGRAVRVREDDARNAQLNVIAERHQQLQRDTLIQMETLGLLPAKYASELPGTASRWMRAEQAIDTQPIAGEIRRTLRDSRWHLVSHVTKAKKLASVARLGIIDGGMVDLLALPGQDRRPHGDRRKQDVLESAVFCSFWPAWWLFTEHHFGNEEAVILLVDAEHVCLQPGCAFVDGAVRRSGVTLHTLRNSRNTAEGGLDAWKACWDGALPIKTKEQQPEIICDRIHPVHIKKVLFVNEDMRDRFYPEFEASFRESWPHLGDRVARPAIAPFEQADQALRFAPSYEETFGLAH